MATVITGPDELQAKVGAELGVSDWVEITQELIDRFADVTGDHQFIHVDPERAAATPLGTTIAHGLLTLAIGPGLGYTLYEIRGAAFTLNYGYDKVRFPAPVPVGSRVRLRGVLSAVEDLGSSHQVVITQTFEREGADKPVCVAESVLRVVFA